MGADDGFPQRGEPFQRLVGSHRRECAASRHDGDGGDGRQAFQEAFEDRRLQRAPAFVVEAVHASGRFTCCISSEFGVSRPP
jgi:hypothetical protein